MVGYVLADAMDTSRSNFPRTGLLFQGLITLCYSVIVGTNWCDMDTGSQTIVDGVGQPHEVYISFKRDGTVWIRAGQDHKDRDWAYTHEKRDKFQGTIVDMEMIDMVASLNYSGYCVLTDIDLVLNMDRAWHPSFVTGFSPGLKMHKILSFRHSKDCYTETNLSFTTDKQSLECDGGKSNLCSTPRLPNQGKRTRTLFLKTVKFDPLGPEHWYCPEYMDRSFYTFMGSYYHAYIKVGTCPRPKDSRTLGYEAKLRNRQDPRNLTDTVIIPDPLQRALSDGTVIRWQAFVKIISPQHDVYLQVWRPSDYYADTYTLVGQTYFHPQVLRFHSIALEPSEYIRIHKGDVVGLYFPNQNPIGWSSVQCAGSPQYFRRLTNPSGVAEGKSYTFTAGVDQGPSACRHYSFTAIFANKTAAKTVEDWVCPTTTLRPDTRKRSGGMAEGHQNSGPYGTADPGLSMMEHKHPASATIPVHLILIIVGSLLVLLLFVGFVSYYKAIKS